MADSIQVLKTKVLHELDSIPVGSVSDVVFKKAQLFKQLQRHDPKVDLMCGFFADKANRIMKESTKVGDDADFAYFYLCCIPPGYLIDLVDGIEGYLRTGKLPKEVAEALS